MTGLEGPFAAACLLLALAGAHKLARPAPVVGALRGVGIPARTSAARALGAAEVVLGTAALVTAGTVPAALVGAAYLGFAGFVLLARRAGPPVHSCGCFGEVDTPPSMVHVAVNLGLAGVAGTVAAGGLPPLADQLADQPGAGLPLALTALVITGLLHVLLTDLVRARQAVRP